jgi:hypothetical protein
MGSSNDDLYRCSDGRTTFALAVTWSAPKDANGNDSRHSAAIQLCKGTVENVEKGWFDHYGNWKKRSLLGFMNAKLTGGKGHPLFRPVGRL